MKKLLLALGLILMSPIALGASIPYFSGQPQDPALLFYYLNQLIQSINQNVGTGSGSLDPKNALDNGAMVVDIRGTGIQTCGTTTVPETAYSADRWGCNANVTSGAGRAQVTTTVPAPPANFQNSQRLYRTSGALTQPVCMWQEVPTYKAISLANMQVAFSVYAQALAGLNADNGSVANLVIVSGTGSDEGLQTFTASPAITPAFTGVATLTNTPITITTSWVRYNTPLVSVPANVTELAVAVCFTPTATGAGTTDGLAFTGAQLEPLGANATGPTVFQFKLLAEEKVEVQQYAIAVPEAASGVAQFNGNVTATNTCEFAYSFPVPMRAAPTLSQIGTAIAAGTTYKTNSATGGVANVSAMATKTANSVTAASFTVTSAAATAGQACTLEGLAGGAIPLWAADF